MTNFNRFYVYEGNRPVGIIEGADQMLIDDINKLARCLKLCFNRDIHMKPIHPGDFDFDPISGRRLNRIDTFVYPEFFDPIKD